MVIPVPNDPLVEYKVLAVKKEYFGNINIGDTFFESFKRDYDGFEKWFNRKADEIAYTHIPHPMGQENNNFGQICRTGAGFGCGPGAG